MQLARIRIKDKAANSVMELVRKGVRVICLPDNIYVVPLTSLQLLDIAKVSYEVVSKESFDNVIKEIRDSLAPKI